MPSIKVVTGALASLVLALSCVAQKPSPVPAGSTSTAGPDQAQIVKLTEAYLRNLFGWGQEFQLQLGPATQSQFPAFYVVPLRVSFNDKTSSGEVYVSKDGKTLVRGEMLDMSVDPFADAREKIQLAGNPSKGPMDAPVTLVEFADLQCPDCRAAESGVKNLLDQYKIRLVYKEFPLRSIHPWAETAAIGARCAFMQSPDGFWKVHDAIFANQDSITIDNVQAQIADFASQAGLDATALKACISSPDSKKTVDTNRDNGVDVGVDGTPTFFVNGRPVVGGDMDSIRRLIDFETSAHPK